VLTGFTFANNAIHTEEEAKVQTTDNRTATATTYFLSHWNQVASIEGSAGRPTPKESKNDFWHMW